MRLDLWLWLAGGTLALIAGVLLLLRRTDATSPRAQLRSPVSLAAGWGLWAPLALACGGLACLVAGLVWRILAGGSRLWPPGPWPGSTAADGVAMLAGGTLAILSWILLSDARRAKAGAGGLDRDRAVAEALALLGSCLLVLLAIGAAWLSPPPAPFPQARSWLFGLRVVAASLGLGAWLPAFADAGWGLRRGKGSSGPGTMCPPPGPQAMRTAYPWLTMAWILGAIWSLAMVAAPWRGQAPDTWLMVAWLLGGIYLVAGGDARPTLIPQWALILLTACGTAAAVMQAWLTPLLLS